MKDGSYVVVQYTTKRSRFDYVALVEKLDSQKDTVDVLFMKKTQGGGFIFAEEEERDTVALEDITRVLPDPTVISGSARCSAKRKFDIDLAYISG